MSASNAAPVPSAPASESALELKRLLEQHFGYRSFRPLQEKIIEDTLAGRDVLALMPTGGGKSLCYQLPALVRPGLTVVVSPLIALMKDQVDALRRQGIPAALMNSTLDAAQLRQVTDGLRSGQYRLLYVAPERLMKFGFLNEIASWKPALFAIDEAHCISDWGHDFRPEYRQLRELRLRFPDVPVMALTATATERVRTDIVAQLGLRDAGIYVASFNRPNLHYVVERKKKSFERLVTFARRHPGESGIVYCGTRAGTENLAARLRAAGFKAAAYHAGMDAPDRATTQEDFLEDRVDIICATIAFGMGVDKPDIRFVVHYDLPKNIESYYQETGRAGRDGDPAECLLLFGKSDLIQHERRIDEKESAHEREIARQQLEGMVAFGESAKCRRKLLLAYFGEESDYENCGGCDNCLREGRTETFGGSPEDAADRVDRTQDARRFIACLDQITRESFPVGATWVVDVLTGSSNEKIGRHGHNRLEAFGRGKSVNKADWNEVGRELVNLGFLERTEHNALRITPSGRQFALGRTDHAVAITSSRSAPSSVRAGKASYEGTYDDQLFERLRALRRRITDEQQAPAFTVFSDAALRGMSREYPETEAAFLRISGVGEAKLQTYGETFMREIREHVRTEGRRELAEPAAPPPSNANGSELVSMEMFRGGKSVQAIAEARSIKPNTVLGHLLRCMQAGEDVDIGRFLTEEQRGEIARAADKHGWNNLSGIHEALGQRYEYNVLRMARMASRSHTQAP
jgi:ATP-dependent DNA helicase RecQ